MLKQSDTTYIKTDQSRNTAFTQNNIAIVILLTEGELFDAPERVRIFFRDLPKENLEVVKITNEAITLAKSYIEENVVGKTSFNDCVHIALATIHKVDILVSWNFKHIVNVYRIRNSRHCWSEI